MDGYLYRWYLGDQVGYKVESQILDAAEAILFRIDIRLYFSCTEINTLRYNL